MRKQLMPPSRHVAETMRISLFSLLWAMLHLTCAWASAEPLEKGMPTLLPVTAEIQALAARSLTGFHKGKATFSGTNQNGAYTLSGDLFDDGHLYAITDTTPIVISRWTRAGWIAKAAIDDTALWKYPRWAEEHEGREPISPKPFWMMHLQHHALLVIASTVEKAGQNYTIILFKPGLTGISDAEYSISSFLNTPCISAGYLVTDDGSRVKAEWGKRSYSRISRGKFVELKNWESYTPYNDNGEGPSYRARNAGKSYHIEDTVDVRPHRSTWKVERVTGGREAPLWRATVTLSTRGPSGYPTEAELAYLFSRTTGLPRNFCPEIDRTTQWQTRITAKVDGNAEARKLFSRPSFGKR